MSLFADARKVIAGGVNSPVRAFAGVGGEPVFFKSASGAWVESEDGRRFIDYVGSWGPMILGHAHPAVLEAATIGVPDERRGETVKAFVVLKAGHVATADELLARYCTLVYSQTGNYQETARRLELDRRTVKARIDPDLLSDLSGTEARARR